MAKKHLLQDCIPIVDAVTERRPLRTECNFFRRRKGDAADCRLRNTQMPQERAGMGLSGAWLDQNSSNSDCLVAVRKKKNVALDRL